MYPQGTVPQKYKGCFKREILSHYIIFVYVLSVSCKNDIIQILRCYCTRWLYQFQVFQQPHGGRCSGSFSISWLTPPYVIIPCSLQLFSLILLIFEYYGLTATNFSDMSSKQPEWKWNTHSEYWGNFVHIAVLGGSIANITTFVQVMPRGKQAPSHYEDQYWPNWLTHICSTRGRWFKYGPFTFCFFQKSIPLHIRSFYLGMN